MKTAMQELLKYVEWSNSGIVIYIPDELKEQIGRKIEELLEKEKKQIENAFEYGYTDSMADPEIFGSGKGYINQIYNQNK